ncbi:hypothetical protein HK100_009120 [Physocladia obscura]|uniref:NAD(P)-binding domain-containing protein n=1 Tax=Physocladia obscura TaxID=109957 RepID=A0AAD5TBU5_9FUNG|nr:hypothetical protein HK100_009120 [Physocladia obscura]
MLVYGATGRAGSLVVEKALAQGWAVYAFVRNPNRLSAELRANARLTVVQGNLNDAAAIALSVKQAQPHAIVDASSAVPASANQNQANDADRPLVVRATVAALADDARLADCVLLIVGGQLIPEPGGAINSWSAWLLALLLRTVVARKAWRDAEEMLRWCFYQSDPRFRFIYARMGYMVEEPTRGTLIPEPTENNIQNGPASYCDVADAFCRLAADPDRAWERKPIFFNYAKI